MGGAGVLVSIGSLLVQEGHQLGEGVVAVVQRDGGSHGITDLGRVGGCVVRGHTDQFIQVSSGFQPTRAVNVDKWEPKLLFARFSLEVFSRCVSTIGAIFPRT